MRYEESIEEMEAHVAMMATIPHKFIPDVHFTLDTSGEACVTCGLHMDAKVHEKYREYFSPRTGKPVPRPEHDRLHAAISATMSVGEPCPLIGCDWKRPIMLHDLASGLRQ